MIEQRDLLIVPFPFSDQSGRKIRPVIVVSNNNFNSHSEDVIAVGVTSNVKKERYALGLTNYDLDNGSLFTNCAIKVENILRLEKGLVIKKIGKINEKKLKEIHSVLDKIIK
ncbi:MAG TPA: type II toxin-antitoxin system PemK/MazF family toxin [Candidatus Nanoarchaeia archaeon]|nr:type II toxin-antitoxin system PemK/MazF family toxin [Candidatus Nanoarchaeia archaeon]